MENFDRENIDELLQIRQIRQIRQYIPHQKFAPYGISLCRVSLKNRGLEFFKIALLICFHKVVIFVYKK